MSGFLVSPIYGNREHSGSKVECLTRDLLVTGSSLTSITVLRPCIMTRHINPCLVLVQPNKTHPDITKTLLTGMYKESNQRNVYGN